MKPKYIMFTIIFLNSFLLWSTAQHPDILIYAGIKYSLYSNPLEEYFLTYPDKRPDSGLRSSALWRGYIATFEVSDNKLYLIDIEIQLWDEEYKEDLKIIKKSVFNEVFPGESKVFLDWYSGILVIPYGECVNYVHMGYGSTYEYYILLQINNGILEEERRYTNDEYTEFRKMQFEEFKKTEEYKKLVEDLFEKKGYDQEFIDSFLFDLIIDYTSKFLVDLE